MGLEQVQEEILDTARKEADTILAEAKAKINVLKKEQNHVRNEFKRVALAETEQELQILQKRCDAQMHLEEKKVVMETKKRLLDDAYKKALEQVEKWNDSQRSMFIRAALTMSSKQMGIGKAYCSEKDKPLVVKERGKQVKIEIAPINGIIIENNDATQRLDFTYDALGELVREKTLQDVARTLF